MSSEEPKSQQQESGQQGALGTPRAKAPIVRTIAFYKSLRLRSKTYIEPRPEIAFAGRSNAGKSSLINYLSGRKRLAYVGKQPGKTRLVNYFVVNGDFYLVDLPGYGYAKVSKQELASWAKMMETFFHESEDALCGIVVCMDIRREPTEQDIQMVEWARFYNVPCIVAATKCDKVAKSKRPQAAQKIAKALRESAEEGGEVPVYPVSSLDRTGAERIFAAMEDMLAQARGEQAAEVPEA